MGQCLEIPVLDNTLLASLSRDYGSNWSASAEDLGKLSDPTNSDCFHPQLAAFCWWSLRSESELASFSCVLLDPVCPALDCFFSLAISCPPLQTASLYTGLTLIIILALETDPRWIPVSLPACWTLGQVGYWRRARLLTAGGNCSFQFILEKRNSAALGTTEKRRRRLPVPPPSRQEKFLPGCPNTNIPPLLTKPSWVAAAATTGWKPEHAE